MNLIDNLVDFFKKPEEEIANKTPKGLCPVCWGYQQYNGKIRILLEDRQIDINNHKQVRPFFEEVIVKHVDGIKLRTAEFIPCPDCNSRNESKAVIKAKKPIKRKKALRALSREHHFGLLLCWKIRQGMAKGADLSRIRNYVEWFWENNLKLHFELEEKYLFALLEEANPNVITVLNQHQKIRELINNIELTNSYFEQLQSEIERHIRFEERVLFNEIQDQASAKQLKVVEEKCSHVVTDDWKDEFWK